MHAVSFVSRITCLQPANHPGSRCPARWLKQNEELTLYGWQSHPAVAHHDCCHKCGWVLQPWNYWHRGWHYKDRRHPRTARTQGFEPSCCPLPQTSCFARYLLPLCKSFPGALQKSFHSANCANPGQSLTDSNVVKIGNLPQVACRQWQKNSDVKTSLSLK